jgi:hypothetical protein
MTANCDQCEIVVSNYNRMQLGTRATSPKTVQRDDWLGIVYPSSGPFSFPVDHCVRDQPRLRHARDVMIVTTIRVYWPGVWAVSDSNI